MVLTYTHNKENSLPSKAKHAKSKSSQTNTATPPPKTVTRKPRSRSHIPLPTSSPTPSPVLPVRKHATAANGDASPMDVDMADSPPPIIVTDSSAAASTMPAPPSPYKSKRAIRLPRTLKKPVPMPVVHQAALHALGPELSNVPLQYAIDTLRLVGKGMLQVACSSTAQPPSNHLPRELQVLIHDTTFPPPTHVFAVYSRTPNNNVAAANPKKVTLHPAHGVILAAHCANLPALPASQSDSETEPETESEPTPNPSSSSPSSSNLPIIPLALPSPNTFPILLAYLYTKQPQGLFGALLPPVQPFLTLSNSNPNPAQSSSSDPTTPTTPVQSLQSPIHLSRILAQTYTTQALLAHAARVHGLWANIVALGVSDPVAWRVVQFVWAVLIAALDNAVSAQ